MKYVVFLGDGMADLPLPSLQNKTPLIVAHKPYMDRIAAQGLAGMVKTVPDGLAPGSDTANMSVMGFDPRVYYSGRSPLEAISMGIDLATEDVAFRCNLVTLSPADAKGQISMEDYSSDEITSEEAAELIASLKTELDDADLTLYAGKSYRHCLVWHKGPLDTVLTPPHDILTQKIDAHQPQGPGADRIRQLTEKSQTILAKHPVNLARAKRGLRTANSIWIWGQGTKPQLPSIKDTYGLKGAAISAVDLIFGLAICADMKTIEVEGATGNIHTNFAGKAQAAIRALEGEIDYIYLHLEAPDESGHRAELDNKIRSIEQMDYEIVGPVWDYLEKERLTKGQEYRLLLLPDHPTPIELRTHTADPVPFAIYDSTGLTDRLTYPKAASYDEQACLSTKLLVEAGHTLFGRFVSADFDF